MMLRNIIMTKEKEDEKNKLNNSNLQINRGFELMLKHNNREEKPSEPKVFQFRFGKMLSLLNREIHFQIDFFFDMKKK